MLKLVHRLWADIIEILAEHAEKLIAEWRGVIVPLDRLIERRLGLPEVI